ncbi:hypothetical protein YC2023_067419 [Brassica napus]
MGLLIGQIRKKFSEKCLWDMSTQTPLIESFKTSTPPASVSLFHGLIWRRVWKSFLAVSAHSLLFSFTLLLTL